MGQQRPGDAPDLLPPPPEGGAPGRPADRRRPAPDVVSAQWADLWLGLDVGSDIALANAMGREIIAAGLANDEFIARATTGFEAYRAAVEPYTLEYAERETGRPGRGDPRGGPRLRHGRPGDDLLDPGHHRAPQRGRQRPRADQPRAADAGTSGGTAAASTRSAARTTSRAAATWARCPDRLPGFQHVENDELRAKFDDGVGRHESRRSAAGTCRAMFDAMERGELTALYVHRREPDPVRGRPAPDRAAAARASTRWSSRTSS